MKHVGFSLILLSIIVLTASIIIADGHKTNRKNEIEVALGVAVDNALTNVTIDKTYDIENQDEFIADFLEDLLLQLDSDSTVKVTIKDANISKGILSVDIVQEFTYNNGKSGSVNCERTVIFDRDKNASTSQILDRNNELIFTIQFYVPTANGQYELYKTISVKNGDTISTSLTPTITGKTFKGWKKSKTEAVVDISNIRIINNMSFYADFK